MKAQQNAEAEANGGGGPHRAQSAPSVLGSAGKPQQQQIQMIGAPVAQQMVHTAMYHQSLDQPNYQQHQHGHGGELQHQPQGSQQPATTL